MLDLRLVIVMNSWLALNRLLRLFLLFDFWSFYWLWSRLWGSWLLWYFRSWLLWYFRSWLRFGSLFFLDWMVT